MQLFAYDHSPCCLKVRMVIQLHQISCKVVFLPYDNDTALVDITDEVYPPILEKDDQTLLTNSSDIITYIEEDYADSPELHPEIRDKVEAWADSLTYTDHLIAPRIINLGLPEFRTDSAKAYFIQQQTALLGDFDTLLEQTPQYIKAVEAHLEQLSPLINNRDAMGDIIGYEDLLVLPILRNLSCVKGLVFPDRVREYMDTLSDKLRIRLYFNKAC